MQDMRDVVVGNLIQYLRDSAQAPSPNLVEPLVRVMRSSTYDHGDIDLAVALARHPVRGAARRFASILTLFVPRPPSE